MKLPEIEHRYGENIHILNDPYLLTVLAQIGSPDTSQPKLNTLISFVYRRLLENTLNCEFTVKPFEIATRMTSYYPDQKFEGPILDPNQRAVCVNLARAGTLPSHICYDHLNFVLDPEGVRQDHVFAARVTDKEEKVTGTSLGTAKIGGDIDDAIVLFPDPMGATGNTLSQALTYYKSEIQGVARKFIALHLIITPEYIRRVTKSHPDLIVYAIRLDRGFSTPTALKAIPGTYPDQEKGLNERQYIVPGAGGLGEVLNNSFV